MILRTVVALASALLLAAAPAFAGPQPAAPAAQAFSLGRLKLVALCDALNVLPNDGEVFGMAEGPDVVAAVLKQAGAPASPITLSVDALLVEGPPGQGRDRVMLFDTGLGPKVGGVLMGSLALAGVSPDAVTDVFITHAHGDHVGGLLTADGRPACPHAVIHMSAREWASMQAQPRAAAMVAAIGAQVRVERHGPVAGLHPQQEVAGEVHPGDAQAGAATRLQIDQAQRDGQAQPPVAHGDQVGVGRIVRGEQVPLQLPVAAERLAQGVVRPF